MTTLVVGASGATGRLLVEQLLEQGEKVKIIVRSVAGFPEAFIRNERLSITEASLMHMTDPELSAQVEGCWPWWGSRSTTSPRTRASSPTSS